MSKIKLTKKEKNTLTAVLIVLFLITAASWVLNFGWTRAMLTFVLFPVIHYVAALLINIFSARYMRFSAKLKVFTLLYNISYVLFYLSFPDGGDVGENYILFNLIKSDKVADIAGYFAWAFFAVCAVLFILQIIEIARVRKKQKNLQSEADINL